MKIKIKCGDAGELRTQACNIYIVGVNESTTVSSAWELTSVSMHYSQGNGIHSPLSRACTVPAFSK